MPSKIKRGPFQKPPIRFALADLNDEPTSVSTVPSAVKVPRGHRKGQPSFEWADKKFFVVVAEDEDGHHCAVDKDLKLRYEIFDSNDTSTTDPIHSSGTAKTWQKKYFWVSAVTFVEDGKYEIRFSADCKKYNSIPPLSFFVTAIPAGGKGASERDLKKRSLNDLPESEGLDTEEGSDYEGELQETGEVNLESFHPSALRDMPRVKMQHLVVKIGLPAKGPNQELRRELINWYNAQGKSESDDGAQLANRSASPTAEALLADFEPKVLGGLRREKLQNMVVAIGEPARVSNEELRTSILNWHKGSKKLPLSSGSAEIEASEGSGNDGRPHKRPREEVVSPKRSKWRSGGAEVEQLDQAGSISDLIPQRLQSVLLESATITAPLSLPRPTSLASILARFSKHMATSGDAPPELVEQMAVLFEGTLGTLLLYPLERPQFESMSLSTDLRATYGAEHLLRLLALLPVLMEPAMAKLTGSHHRASRAEHTRFMNMHRSLLLFLDEDGVYNDLFSG